MKNKSQRLWARIGVSMEVTAEEAEKILSGSDDERTSALVKVFTEGRVVIDGDSYIPEGVVEEYNQLYGMSFLPYDVELELSPLEHKNLRVSRNSPMRDKEHER